MLLFDATHTSHTRAQTGIQRVCRALAAELAKSGPLEPVCYDPFAQGWRALDQGERAVLADRTGGAGRSRGAKWSLGQKITGHARRLTGRRADPPVATGLVCPELFSARVGARLPELFARVRGPRVAIFHDAIGLRLPEFTPPATVARLPGYLRELLAFDGVAAVSEDSASCLRDYWNWLGAGPVPSVVAIAPGLDPIPPLPASPATERPRVLCVATIEGRKNHLALLEAAEALWREKVDFELELIGLPRPDTAAAALARIDALRAAGRPLTAHGSVNEASLHAAYARCTFTVYPSLAEGFGLPVLESLQHGKPCLCPAHGALGESARGGGGALLATTDPTAIAAGLRRLLTRQDERETLAAAARARTFRTWSDYATDLQAWMRVLPRRT